MWSIAPWLSRSGGRRMFDPESWLLQILVGGAVVGVVVGACYGVVWLLCRVPAGTGSTVGVLEAERSVQQANLDATVAAWTAKFGEPVRPQPSFVVAARLVGGMGDGEEVEVHSQLWLAHPPTELRVTAVDSGAVPPVVHHLLYRVSPEDSQVFVFAGVASAPHGMEGD